MENLRGDFEKQIEKTKFELSKALQTEKQSRNDPHEEINNLKQKL